MRETPASPRSLRLCSRSYERSRFHGTTSWGLAQTGDVTRNTIERHARASTLRLLVHQRNWMTDRSPVHSDPRLAPAQRRPFRDLQSCVAPNLADATRRRIAKRQPDRPATRTRLFFAHAWWEQGARKYCTRGSKRALCRLFGRQHRSGKRLAAPQKAENRESRTSEAHVDRTTPSAAK